MDARALFRRPRLVVAGAAMLAAKGLYKVGLVCIGIGTAVVVFTDQRS